MVPVIIRNFLCHPGLLAYMEEVVKENLQHPKSMCVCIIFNLFTSSYSSSSHSPQLVNTGKIVQVEISAGAHSKPFDQLDEEHQFQVTF